MLPINFFQELQEFRPGTQVTLILQNGTVRGKVFKNENYKFVVLETNKITTVHYREIQSYLKTNYVMEH